MARKLKLKEPKKTNRLLIAPKKPVRYPQEIMDNIRDKATQLSIEHIFPGRYDIPLGWDQQHGDPVPNDKNMLTGRYYPNEPYGSFGLFPGMERLPFEKQLKIAVKKPRLRNRKLYK